MFRTLHETDGDAVTILIDGEPATATAGETVAAVILRQREAWTRLTPETQDRRAPYCMMGVCFECLVAIDGVASQQACLIPVRAGISVTRQLGKRRLHDDDR